MRVRFLSTVGLRTGPQYSAGEVAEVADADATRLLGLGLVERVVAAATTQDIASPPIDRMMRPRRTRGGD